MVLACVIEILLQGFYSVTVVLGHIHIIVLHGCSHPLLVVKFTQRGVNLLGLQTSGSSALEILGRVLGSRVLGTILDACRQHS